MSRTVRCPRCNTLLAVPPRVEGARMTCAICLAPVGLVQDPFPAEPLPPRARPGRKPEVFTMAESDAEEDVYRNAMVSRLISGFVIFMLLIGLPRLALDKLGLDVLPAVLCIALILSAAVGLAQKQLERPQRETHSTSAGVVEGLLSFLGVIALGVAQAIVGLILTAALLLFLLWITCVGMK